MKGSGRREQDTGGIEVAYLAKDRRKVKTVVEVRLFKSQAPLPSVGRAMGGRGSCRSYLHEATIAADDKIASSELCELWSPRSRAGGPCYLPWLGCYFPCHSGSVTTINSTRAAMIARATR